MSEVSLDEWKLPLSRPYWITLLRLVYLKLSFHDEKSLHCLSHQLLALVDVCQMTTNRICHHPAFVASSPVATDESPQLFAYAHRVVASFVHGA